MLYNGKLLETEQSLRTSEIIPVDSESMKVIMNLWMYGNYLLCSGIKKKKSGIQGPFSSPALGENLKPPAKSIMEYQRKFL